MSETTTYATVPEPCPWCSGKPVVTGVNRRWVSCLCAASGPAKKTTEEAIMEWNRVAMNSREFEAAEHERMLSMKRIGP